MEDSHAVELLKGGKLDGLEFLVRQYYFQAVHISYLIVQDSDLAEDVVQDAFIHAYEKIDQLTSEHFGAWFMRVVVNASIKAAGKQKRQVSLDGHDEDAAQVLAELLVDQRPSTEEMVESEDLRQSIWKALSQLDPNQRAAIVMKYILEMSEAEITRELNTPLTTVKWRLHSAREKLRRLLNPLRSSSSPSEPKKKLPPS